MRDHDSFGQARRSAREAQECRKLFVGAAGGQSPRCCLCLVCSRLGLLDQLVDGDSVRVFLNLSLVAEQDNFVGVQTNTFRSTPNSVPRGSVCIHQLTLTGFEDIGHLLNTIFGRAASDNSPQSNGCKCHDRIPDGITAENGDMATRFDTILASQRRRKVGRKRFQSGERNALSGLRIDERAFLSRIEFCPWQRFLEQP